MKKNLFTITYVIYGLVCLAACLWAEKAAFWAKSMAGDLWNPNYYIAAAAFLALLGVAWAGEHCLAKMADKKAAVAVRILQIVVLAIWSVTLWKGPVLPQTLIPRGYGIPAIWLLLGLQLFSTVELLVKKPKST